MPIERNQENEIGINVDRDIEGRRVGGLTGGHVVCYNGGMDTNNTPTPTPEPAPTHTKGNSCPACPDFDSWVQHHCYDCGGDRTQPGPYDAEHVLCFATIEDLTPVQRANLRYVAQDPHAHVPTRGFPLTCNVCRQGPEAH